jgi:predicted transcriptional regulator
MLKSMNSAPRTQSIRISSRPHELLSQLAKDDQRSMQSVVERALERYHRERFLRAANADFAALKQDGKSWEQELHDRRLWDQSLADGH